MAEKDFECAFQTKVEQLKVVYGQEAADTMIDIAGKNVMPEVRNAE